jgi:hypothetical protein
MAGVRIRWRGVARAAAIVLVGLIALRLLPGLLRAPEPPPLGADVGLPRSRPVTSEPTREVAEPKGEGERAVPAPHKKARQRRPRRHPSVRASAGGPASTAVIGSRRRPASQGRRRPRDRRPRRHRRRSATATPRPPEMAPEAVESTSPAAPEYVPPVPPEASSAPLPEPSSAPSSTPADGSQEFAPH